MELIGYARISIIDQDPSSQIDALSAAGCTKLFIENKKNGSATQHEQIAFEECMAYLRKGDTLVVTRVDRLTRSIIDLQKLLKKLREKQVHLKAIDQPIDTSSATGKEFIAMLGIFSDFETNMRRERQLEGIAIAKLRGAYRGRKPSIDPKEVRRLYEDEKLGGTEISLRLGVSRAAIYRVLDKK